MKKGEKIKYKILPEAEASKNGKISIFGSEEKKIKLSEKECEEKEGC